MTVEGELVSFVDVPRDRYDGRVLLPRNLKEVYYVPENDHTFFKDERGNLFMRNCVRDFFEIEGDFKHLSYEDISNDYENAPDPWGERWFSDSVAKRRPKPVRVRPHRRRT